MFINRVLRAADEGAPSGGASAPAATPAPAKVPDAPAPQVADQPWANDRTVRAQRTALRAAGIKVDKDQPIDQAIAAARAKADNRKEQLKVEKAAREAADLKVAEFESERSGYAVFAEAELSLLSDDHKKLVTADPKKDPAKALEQIANIKRLAASITPPKVEAPPAADPVKPLVAPASTGTPQGAPPPAGPGAALPVKEQITQLRNIADPNKRALSVALFALDNADALLRDS